MDFQQRGLLYPALSNASVRIRRSLLPSHLELPAKIDDLLTREAPRAPALDKERAALQRYAKLQNELTHNAKSKAAAAASTASTPMEVEDPHKEVIDRFMGFTSADRDSATKILKENDWDLEASVTKYYES